MARGFAPLELSDLADLGYAPKHFRKPKAPAPIRCDAKPTPEDQARMIDAMRENRISIVRDELVRLGQLTVDATDAQIIAIITTIRQRMPELFTQGK